MKILVVSDTHGQHRNLNTVIEKVGPIDMLVHLGDFENGEAYIEQVANCPTHMIAGNNDFFSRREKEEEFYIGKYGVFITHGHRYRVSLDLQWLIDEAKSREADIVMFGHTHKPSIAYDGGITFINPGSLSYPRQEGRKGSYILMEIDRQGESHFTINYV